MVLVLCAASTPSPTNRINTEFQFDIICSYRQISAYVLFFTQTLSTLRGFSLTESIVLNHVKLLPGEYLLSFSGGWHLGCTYLAVLLTSDLSIFTATRTGWWVNSEEETPRNSSRPSASQRCTCRKQWQLWEQAHAESQSKTTHWGHQFGQHW